LLLERRLHRRGVRDGRELNHDVAIVGYGTNPDGTEYWIAKLRTRGVRGGVRTASSTSSREQKCAALLTPRAFLSPDTTSRRHCRQCTPCMLRYVQHADVYQRTVCLCLYRLSAWLLGCYVHMHACILARE
jgi:hypothetical protein